MKHLILLLILLVTTAAYGDYIDLKRSTTLKSEPNSSGDIVSRIQPPATLVLLENDEQNGYYHVRTDTGDEGWVYRTMGRRFAGLAPSPDGVPAASRGHSSPPSDSDFAVAASHDWGQSSKSAGCKNTKGLPDAACTPGDILKSTEAQVCSSDFHTGTVRDKTTSAAQKSKVYPMYDIDHPEHNTGSNQVCEIDHLVALELGGADTMANLWPQCSPGYENWQGPSFRDKDGFENYLWFHVCINRDITLKDAQIEIATDWRKYWELAGKPDCHNREKCE
jgi:5-methylcytosine-specific restriction endonuclease McrA